MGAVGLVALMSGRAGRSCSSLSGAILVLVLLEPDLALSMGFLLSVAATLGIALLGPPLTGILAARMPAWLAVAVAVPLSAQLMCGPLVVLIQPSFLTLSLAANIAVSPFVPIVTVAGTVALATCTWCPPVALLCTAVGGAAAQAVAGTARLLASLPGAALPWPDGLAGAGAMAVMSTVNVAALWAAFSPAGRRAALRLVRALAA
jgi:competence protein ComEC